MFFVSDYTKNLQLLKKATERTVAYAIIRGTRKKGKQV